MRNRKIILILSASAMAVIFVTGLADLALLRFDAGDVYPPYSSLRADPLGTKALYESLEELRSVSVSRNYRPLKKTPIRQGSILCLGVNPPEPKELFAKDPVFDWEPQVSAGARLVVALQSGTKTAFLPWDLSKKADVQLVRLGSAASRAAGSVDDPAFRGAKPAGADLGDELPWHNAMYFDQLGPQWKALYKCGGKPVIVERPYQKGSIVLCSDSFFLSNEALLTHSPARLLSRLIVGPEVVFDETHLGVTEETGVANLARNYHLDGVLLALLFVAALLVWRNSVSFIPRSEGQSQTERAGEGEGKDSGAGLLSLLRRTIPPAELPAVCFQEWRRSRPDNDKRNAAKTAAIQSIVQQEQSKPASKRDPVQAYRAACKALTEKKPHGT